jgi:hypothetical protein
LVWQSHVVGGLGEHSRGRIKERPDLPIGRRKRPEKTEVWFGRGKTHRVHLPNGRPAAPQPSGMLQRR